MVQFCFRGLIRAVTTRVEAVLVFANGSFHWLGGSEGTRIFFSFAEINQIIVTQWRLAL